MSFTSTIGSRTENNQYSGTILLSPSKRLKIDPQADVLSPTLGELWRWTFTPDATSPCFIKDIFDMRENAGKEADFFWLGRVPCRTVRIVGLLVGVHIYEKRIRYTVDDGTAVIDCFYRQELDSRTLMKRQMVKSTLPVFPPPKPVGGVGVAVSVTGRIVKKFDTRELVVTCIERNASSNDELSHWRLVHGLHKSSYFHPDPFTLPARPSTPSPVKVRQEPPTPSNMTPASSVVSSPTKSEVLQRSPHKLRHPSRLSSRNLTDNSFRLYMKHYLYHAHTTISPANPGYDSEEEVAYSLSRAPTTPTKSFQYQAADATPRPGLSRTPKLTPRPRRAIQLSFSDTEPASPVGFTLSHLRRVPELADMARRVVRAEAKRRTREERKKDKEGETTQARSRRTAAKAQAQQKEDIGPRAKRLFKHSLVQLLREGSIILWDGPVRQNLPNPSSLHSSMWKADSTSNSTIGGDISVFSSVSGSTQAGDLDDDMDAGELSDPDPNEEAYLPLTPTYMAAEVERAINALNTPTKNGDKRPVSGSSNDDILKFLRKDDRWRHAGIWNVDEGLEVLKTDGRVWCVGKGRWELTL